MKHLLDLLSDNLNVTWHHWQIIRKSNNKMIYDSVMEVDPHPILGPFPGFVDSADCYETSLKMMEKASMDPKDYDIIILPMNDQASKVLKDKQLW